MTETAPAATTTDAGIPVESDEHSLSIGPDGPILLHDHYLIEQLAAFNRERVPERQPHAKGSGAFGRFEVTHDVSAFTKAALFAPGTTTETVIRFSTVAGERGSPDTWRDPRGFALKFYTTEGNYDIIGNDTPVFFLRDPLKFGHFIRSQQRRADNNLRDHDMQWDFGRSRPKPPTRSPGCSAIAVSRPAGATAGPSEMHSDSTYLSSPKRKLPAANKPEPRPPSASSVRICRLLVALHAAAMPHAQRDWN